MTVFKPVPRVLIAAPKSGSGKTMISCGLMQIMKEDGEKVHAFKCGPDYIDPMFHRRVLGIPSENLDPFFAGPEQIRAQLCAGEEGSIALIEGVMGIYDGVGGTQLTGSAYHVAQITDSPIVLVMDVRGMGATMLSLLKGILGDDRDHRVRGVILNRITKNFYERMRPLISQLGVEPLGFLPVMKGVGLESRHLGLKQPEEIESLNDQLHTIAEGLRENVQLDALRRIMKEAPEVEVPEKTSGPAAADALPMVLAVARDPAFTFYYEANLRAFRERGITIREFSPLKDSGIPKEADGLLLGGGYPELYCPELSGNRSMRESIREAILGGMPSLAECGGFMYLHESMTDPEGRKWPMAGVIPGGSSNTGKLCRFGYVELEKNRLPGSAVTDGSGNEVSEEPSRKERPDAALLREGEQIRGHEFHYYDSETNGTDCIAVKTGGNRRWECAFLGREHLWGFPHLYYPSAPFFLERFIAQMKEYHFEKMTQ